MLVPAVIGVAMAIETAVISDARGPLWANVVAIFALVAPLVARRRHPILAAATSLLVGLAMSAVLTSIPETVTGVALLVVIFYSVGAWARRWWWLVGWGVAAIGAVAMEWASGGGSDSTGGDDEWIVLIGPLAPWLSGASPPAGRSACDGRGQWSTNSSAVGVPPYGSLWRSSARPWPVSWTTRWHTR